LFYKGVNKATIEPSRLSQTLPSDGTAAVEVPGRQSTHTISAASSSDAPPYLFDSGSSLLQLTEDHNMTIAQLVYENEKHFHLTDLQVQQKLLRIWHTMDDCIRVGVTTKEEILPGRLGLKRKAPRLYRRLMRGFYPGVMHSSEHILGMQSENLSPELALPKAEIDFAEEDLSLNLDPRGTRIAKSLARAPHMVGLTGHVISPVQPRKSTRFPAMDFLACYATAVNEVNASGGRIVTSPTNGAAGVIPAVLKYLVEFISDDHERTILTFLLTASAIGMLFKRGATISAAEGGCQAEVGVACSMAAAGYTACMGGSPQTILQAAEIAIEHNLGLTCDPIDGLVQVPCIERNSLGAVKAVSAGQLAMASGGIYSVTFDEALEAMRLTALDMSSKYKETSLSGLAVCLSSPFCTLLLTSSQKTVRIPLSVPAC